MQTSEALMSMVEGFISDHSNKIEALFEEQMRERFRLVLKHSNTIPYGPKGWFHYKTMNANSILSEIRAEEIINENLLSHRRKFKPKATSEGRKFASEIYELVRLGMVMESFEAVTAEEGRI